MRQHLNKSKIHKQTHRLTDSQTLSFVWLCMALYDCVCLCMNMFAYLWLCMTMCDYVWLCMTMYDYVWLCMTMYNYVWLCMTMYEYVWLSPIWVWFLCLIRINSSHIKDIFSSWSFIRKRRIFPRYFGWIFGSGATQ